MFRRTLILHGYPLCSRRTSAAVESLRMLLLLPGSFCQPLGRAGGADCCSAALAILGLAIVVAPGGFAVERQPLLGDIPLMLSVALLCIPVFVTGRHHARP